MKSRNKYPADEVTLRELGLRDGLQLTKSWPGTNSKIDWIARAHAAGVRHFEVGSFLPPSRFPQFADIRELIGAVREFDSAFSSALTLNERAIRDSLKTGVDEIVISVSATEEHSQANIGRSRESAVELIRLAVAERAAAGSELVVAAAISMAFGCSIAGDVRPRDVVDLVEKCLRAGADVIGVADTVGYAGPRQVANLCNEVLAALGSIPMIVHLHDTRGTGIANAYAALQSGVRILDGTLAGLGGCPFAPGATGNVVFEDLVFLCERCGFPTGIDIDRLVEARSIIVAEMPGEKLHGALASAGVPQNIAWKSAKNHGVAGVS